MVCSLKKKLKSNPLTKFLAECLLTAYYNYLLRAVEIVKIWMRKTFPPRNSDNVKLLCFKDRYPKRRCFIIANGPSLTLKDCELLRDEITFSMNAIVDLFDQTAWRPTFYGIQDMNVYERLRERLLDSELESIFVADYLMRTDKERDRFINFPLYFYDHRVTYFTRKYVTKFSGDAYACVYDGYSITYSLIQLAYYMGFREIYLLGCDCSWNGSDMAANHFAGSRTFGAEEDFRTAQARGMSGYRAAKAFLDTHEGEIVNCTRGGALELFPRKKLEEVLANPRYAAR